MGYTSSAILTGRERSRGHENHDPQLTYKSMNFRIDPQVSRLFYRSILPVIAVTLGALVVRSRSVNADTPQSATSRIVGAADAFLSTLNEKQRSAVLYKFDDDKQRARWSNLPIGMVPRGGLSLGELSDAQRAAALALVASTLSPRGYEKVEQIRDADDAFKAIAGDERLFGKNLYYISILGTPSEKYSWMLQFGGHHLALNITIMGEHGVITPSLTGVQPGAYKANGKTVRPLGQENDKAFALLNALDDSQRKQAILNYRVADLVLGPGHDGQTIQPEGLKVSAMNEKQRAMLFDLISEWSGIVNDSFAAARMQEIKAGLDDMWFAWSGPTTVEPGKNGTSYYRIQGPKLVIEYAPQRGEDHVHTIYRDPTNDYGRAFTSK